MLPVQVFRQYYFLWLISLSCLSSSCNSDTTQTEKPKIKDAVLSSKPKLVHKPTGTDKNVLDLLPLSGDTLIAAKFGSFAVTTDAGKHWQEHDPKYWFIKHLAIDEHHVLWGLDSWLGIHEASYSRMMYSQDFGKTWKHRKYDTGTFFPYEFYSLPGQVLQIITSRGKVYQMQDREGK